MQPDAQRHLRLAGGCNFRDLGGYATRDGRRVRWGQVYRSGVMDQLSDADLDRLAQLDIQAVIDLRTTRERARRPSRTSGAWRPGLWARSYDSSAGDHGRALVETTAAEMEASMLKAYRRMPFEQEPAYRELFHRIADGPLPLVFHCHGGKDRTGVAAALLLDMLGVPRETVIEDYVLTEPCLSRDRHVLDAGPEPAIDDGDPALRAPLMRADPRYLDQMFAKLEKDFGSAAGYLEERLGIDAERRLAICGRLLVEA